MKKRILGILILIEIILVLLNIYDMKISYDENIEYLDSISVDSSYISNLNNDIVGYIKLSDKKYLLVQGNDNTYYLNHDAYNNETVYGSIFIDYRCNILEDDTCIIYGHSSKNYDLPFNNLENYQNDSYLDSNDVIIINYYGIDIYYKIIDIVDNYYAYQNQDVLYLQTCDQNTGGLLLLVATKI